MKTLLVISGKVFEDRREIEDINVLDPNVTFYSFIVSVFLCCIICTTTSTHGERRKSFGEAII